ncbi:MAG: S-layer glycoprotein N-glycosyltransferase AglJ [Halobacteriota archaeon]|nr:S-layer glycoprotein N-glycosyltransferase AglJ [Halobacteriota archaeon]
MTQNMKDVCILIPTLNEERSIGEVIEGFKKLGFDKVLVIDGNSSDKTREIAEDAGATVVIQKGKGKGLAVQQAFGMIEDDIVVMIDGDGTYLPSEVNSLLEPILREEADHVIGNRFSNYSKGAFTRLNLLGNKLLNWLFSFAYGLHLDDILSGYRALTKEGIEELELNKAGFEIEAEMAIESVKKEVRISEVPITYEPRIKSATKLNPVRDGVRIGYTLYGLVKTHNPMFYFGLIGACFIFLGLIGGFFVTLDWFRQIERIPLTVLTALLIITGVQIFVFGQLGNLLVALQKEMIRELKKR